jgi:hypothetical protein
VYVRAVAAHLDATTHQAFEVVLRTSDIAAARETIHRLGRKRRDCTRARAGGITLVDYAAAAGGRSELRVVIVWPLDRPAVELHDHLALLGDYTLTPLRSREDVERAVHGLVPLRQPGSGPARDGPARMPWGVLRGLGGLSGRGARRSATRGLVRHQRLCIRCRHHG